MPQYPEKVVRIAEVFKKHGFLCYAVGGCIRDVLMGRTPNDWDMTTDCKPEEMMQIFEKAGIHTIPTGLQHGTVTLRLEGESFECTTFRIDGSYTDSRRPDKVTFTGALADDLCRRDFTVNAMAGDPLSERGEVVDLYGGKLDLERKVIRAVGDPEKRFTEDALRILRALRFATVLDFEIEEKTFSAAKMLAPRLANVSAERKVAELEKLLCSPYADRGIRLLFDADAAWYIHPRMQRPEESVLLLSNRFAPRLAALFDGELPPELSSLKLSGEVSKTVRSLRDRQRFLRACTQFEELEATARNLLREYGEFAADAAILYGKKELAAVIFKEEKKSPCLHLADLAVGGKELMTLGIEAKKFSGILATLLDAVIADPEKNTKECLLRLVKKNESVS